MNGLFYYDVNLTNINMDGFNTTGVGYMERMFLGCEKLTSLDLSNFDTINVRSMESMFEGCINLKNLNLISFNTSRCSNFKLMFERCVNLTIIVDRNSTANMLDKIDLEKINVVELNETDEIFQF